MKHLTLLALVVIAGCSDNISVTPAPEIPEPPGNPGTSLVYVGNVRFDCVVWSGVTNEIIWNAPWGLLAVHCSTGSVRVLDPRPGCRDLQLSGAGDYVYYLLFADSNTTGGGGTLHRCQIVSGFHEAIDSATVWSYCVSPAGAQVAFRRPDSLCIADAESHVAHAVMAGGFAHCFSPDGERLLCSSGNSFFVLTLSTGAVEPVSGLNRTPDGLRWDGDGIKFVAGGGGWTMTPVYEVHNVTSGSVTTIELTSYFTGGWSLTSRRWSLDGSRVALWRYRCIRPAPDENCDLAGYGLYILHLQSRSAVLAACIKTAYSADDVLGDIAFSPDGQSVAYICDRYIRVTTGLNYRSSLN